MKIEEAIKKAKSAGYDIEPGNEEWLRASKDRSHIEVMFLEKILLDKDFWQALGKAMGWKGIYEKNSDISVSHACILSTLIFQSSVSGTIGRILLLGCFFLMMRT